MNDNNRDLLIKLSRLQRLLGRYYHYRFMRHGPMANIHRGQGRILALLKLKPEISQRELTQILDMRPQSLGELLEKLERNGYITRTPSPKDQRVMNISLTEAGKELAKQKEQQADTEDLFIRLNEEEQAALNDYLDRIIETLVEQLGGEEQEPAFMPPYLGGSKKPFDRQGPPPHHGRVKHPPQGFKGFCRFYQDKDRT